MHFINKYTISALHYTELTFSYPLKFSHAQPTTSMADLVGGAPGTPLALLPNATI